VDERDLARDQRVASAIARAAVPLLYYGEK